MYVQCERCKTEYEFDDALVSERGTTVKCTNCSHQFKVRRAGGAATTEDRWVVTSGSGKQLVFTSLKELQRAILAKQVDRADALARGDGAARRLGSIAELEPFFDEKKRQATLSHETQANDTHAHETGAPSANETRPRPRATTIVSTRPPPPPDAHSQHALAAPKRRTDPPPLPMRARVETLRPPDNYLGAVPPPPLVPRTMTALLGSGSVVNAHASTLIAPVPAGAEALRTPDPGPVRSGSTELGLPPAPHSSRMASTPPPPVDPVVFPTRQPSLPAPMGPFAGVIDTVPPQSMRRALASDYSADPIRQSSQSLIERESLPAGRRLGGWVIAAVLLAGVAAVGLYVGKPYLDRMGKPAGNATPLDPRAQGFLAAGEAALAEGNLDLAKESFDKASALAEKDAKVLIATAKLAAVRADVPWLKQRLLLPESEEIQSNRALLEEMSAKAKKAAADAVAVSPEDAAALRVNVDALRIHGDREAARALVGKIATNASLPDTAYVLGALDLAELDPPWPVVVERLRTAAAGEGNAGRARAALIYALTRSGDLAAAKAELDRLSFQPRAHPLLAPLRAFVERARSKVPDGGAPIAVMDLNKISGANAGTLFTPGGLQIGSAVPGANAGGVGAAPVTGSGVGGPSGGPLPSDPRVMLSQAEAAKAKRDFPRARALYEGAIGKNPSDSEALAGLGDVFREQHDTGSALSYYKRALAVNPTYLPALVGLADMQWEGGDHPSAQKTYKDIQDRFPDGSYPARVKQRTEASQNSPSSPASSSPATTDPTE